jgi:hypothetical protein
MATFKVVSEELTAAGVLIRSDDSSLATANGKVGSAGAGALAGTPAAGAYNEFVAAVGTAVSTAHTAIGSLGTALQEAAVAYQTAETSAAGSLKVK